MSGLIRKYLAGAGWQTVVDDGGGGGSFNGGTITEPLIIEDASGSSLVIDDGSGGLIEMGLGKASFLLNDSTFQIHGSQLNVDDDVDLVQIAGLSSPVFVVGPTGAVTISPSDDAADSLTLFVGASAMSLVVKDAADDTQVWIDAGGDVHIARNLIMESFYSGPGSAQAGFVNDDHPDAKAFEVYGFTGTGAPFTVYAGGGDPVFQIQADGSVHILTGTTVVADL